MAWKPTIRFDGAPPTVIPEQGAGGARQDLCPEYDGIAMDGAQWSTIELPKISEVRGDLSIIEAKRNVPFEIERFYYAYNVPRGSNRGGHAHKSLRQLLLALSGSFTVHLDNGAVQTAIALNRPHIGLYIGPGVWRVVDNFSHGAVCLMLASAHYDETEYIRTYTEFETYVAERGKPTVREDRWEDRLISAPTNACAPASD